MAGSYQALDAGTTGDALVDFSGGVCEKIKLATYVDSMDKRGEMFSVSTSVALLVLFSSFLYSSFIVKEFYTAVHTLHDTKSL